MRTAPPPAIFRRSASASRTGRARSRITQELGRAGINIEDFDLHHISPEYGGVLVLVIAGADDATRVRRVLQEAEYPAA